MASNKSVVDFVGRQWPARHWAIRYWHEFVHLHVAAVDAGWGLIDTFVRRDHARSMFGEREREDQILDWAKANAAACEFFREPPIAVDGAEALAALCEQCVERLAYVAEWQDRLRHGVGGVKPFDEPPVPNTWIPASDYRPNGLIRRVAEIVRRLPGGDKPGHPGDLPHADAAISYLERVRDWCDANGGVVHQVTKKQTKRGKPGRPPAPDDDQRWQEKILRNWEAAHRNGASLKEFAKQHGKKPREVRNILAAVRQRRRRAAERKP